MRRFLVELRQRHVFRVAVVYMVAAWLVMQVVDVMFPALSLPHWTITLVVALLLAGFPVALVLAWALELTPEGLRRTDASRPAPAPTDDEAAPAVPSPVVRPDEQPAKSIAVLPFADMSPEHDHEYFSDGLTEELLNVLTRVPELRVSSRTSCFAFKHRDADIRSVAERLGVSHVVEGSVRKSGGRIRVTAQLIETASDSHLWSESWDRDLTDIFAIQDEIARRVVEALALKLHPGRDTDATTRDTRAYDAYLKGRSFQHRFGPKSQGFAIELFRRATTIDPDFAKAWAALAEAYAALVIYYHGGTDVLAEADVASTRAVQLAPELAEAHTSRAVFLSASQRFDEAVGEFDEAVRLNPGLFEAWYFYARAALHQGRHRRALELFRKAAEVNPDDYQGPLIAAPILRSLGHEAQALEAERRGVELAERHLEDYPDNARAYFLALSALHNLGRTAQAMEWTERVIAMEPDDPAVRYNVACFYAQVGEVEKALDFLDGTITSRSWVENDPELEPLRSHPRYHRILDGLGPAAPSGAGMPPSPA